MIKIIKGNRGYGIIISVFLCMLFLTNKAYAASSETEPNNNRNTAQRVNIGEQYDGVVEDVDDVDDEDFYGFNVKEGSFYKVSVTNIEDVGDFGVKTMIGKLCKDSDNDSGEAIISGLDYNDKTVLFRAAYTGNYYLWFSNTKHTKYSFIIENYDPKGKVVKDSDSNTYQITGNYSVEFTKIASKNKDSFYFSTKEYFRIIDGYTVLDYYDADFKVTSIGKNAFKGSKIKSISIPESVTKIGVGAFRNCKNLGTEKYIMGVVIRGKNVKIESKAFYGCKNLSTIRVLKSSSIKYVKKNAFKGTKKKIRLEVPNVKKYKKLFKNAGLKNPKFTKGYM